MLVYVSKPCMLKFPSQNSKKIPPPPPLDSSQIVVGADGLKSESLIHIHAHYQDKTREFGGKQDFQRSKVQSLV